MSAQSFLAKLGLRTATLGSLASLAFAFPLAEGSQDPAAHTDATRTGFFAAHGGTPEIGVVVQGVQSVSVRQTGVVVTGTVSATGTVTSIGLPLTPQATNPGGATTIWVDSAGNILRFGANSLIVGGTTGAVQFNNAGNIDGDASTFFWDNTQKALALGSGVASARLDITGLDLSAAADGSVASLFTHALALTKNDSNTRQFYGTRLRPTFNTGGSNLNTTYDVLNIDTVNGTTTGLTVNLLSLNYGGTNRFKVDSAGVTTIVGVPYTWPTVQGAANSIVQNNGSGVLSWNVVSGDATLDGSGVLTLATTITAGGPTGSGTTVPVITYDAKGRLTAVTTAAITAAGIGAIGGSIAVNQIAYGSGVNTIQGSATFLNVSGQVTLGTATPDATASFTLVGPSLTTQATNSVGSAMIGSTLSKNDSNTRIFYDTLYKPTINAGGSNTTTTFNILAVDTINAATTGVTTNLLSLAYAGTNAFRVKSDGSLTAPHFTINETTGFILIGTQSYGVAGVNSIAIQPIGAVSNNLQAGGSVLIGATGGNSITSSAGNTILISTIGSTISSFNTVGVGANVQVTHHDSMVIGMGAFPGLFSAGINTLAMGMNTTLPTLVLTDAGGAGNLGRVAINSNSAAASLDVTGQDLTTAADGSIAAVFAHTTLAKNDSNIRTFYGTLYKPTFNTGGSNANTTYNILAVDSVNTSLTGLTVNLLNLNFGGSNVASVNSAGLGTFNGGITTSGVLTLSRSGSGTGDYTLGVTGTTVANATSSQIRIGNAIVSGNAAANGGTYLGMNIPASGAGSAADLLHLQINGGSALLLNSSGQLKSQPGAGGADDVNGPAQVTIHGGTTSAPALFVNGFGDTSGNASVIIRTQGLTGGARALGIRNGAHPGFFTFQIGSLGLLGWGNGDVTRDVFLSRSAVGTLAVDGAGVPGNLVVTGLVGFGTNAVNATAIVGITVGNLSTAADQAVSIISSSGTSVSKNDSNTRQFYGIRILPTFNTGSSNLNTTYNVLNVDTVNTSVTGLTVNLFSLNSGGTNVFLVDSTGVTTLPRDGAGAGNYTFGLTGRPNQSASSSLFRLGNGISGGNNNTNGGTYIGISTPGSLGGSAADFVNFQKNGTSVFNITVNGLTGIGSAASASTALLLPISTTAISSLRVPHGAAPTSPVNGDIWTTSTAMFVQINGSTVQLGAGTGTIGGSIAANQIAYGLGSNTIQGSANLTYDGTTLTSASQIVNTKAGAASTPAEILTGTWFSGGSATTTKPQVLIEPTGTTSTTWSTSGTALGINAASGFAGRILDLKVNNVLMMSLDASGNTFQLGTLSTGGNAGFGVNPNAVATAYVSATDTLTTAASGSTHMLLADGTIAKNNTTTATFYGVSLKPTFSAGGSNANTTYNILNIDSVVSSSIGMTINLLSLNHNGSNLVNVAAGGQTTFASRSHSIGGVTYVWPNSQGAASTVLQNDGSGNLSWAAAGAGTIGGSIAANQVAFGNGTNTISGAATLTSDGTFLRLNNSGNTGAIGTGPGSIATSSAAAAFTKISVVSNNTVSPNTNGSAIALYRVSGNYTTPSNIISGEVLGTVIFGGWQTTAAVYSPGAFISGVATGSWSASTGTRPTNMNFTVTDAGGTTVQSLVLSAINGVGNVAVAGVAVSASTSLIVPASTTTVSSLRIPHGSAPTSPVDGDVWTTTAGMFAYINSATVGPFGTGTISGSIALNQVAFGSATNAIAGAASLVSDGTFLRLNNSGNNTGIGSGPGDLSVSAPATSFAQISVVANNTISPTNTTQTALLGLYRMTGNYTTPADVASGNVLGTLGFGGFQTGVSAYNIGASITAVASGAWDSLSAQRPTDLRFFTTNSGGTSIQSLTLSAAATAVSGATVSSSTALIVPASTTSASSLRIPHGSAPTSPTNGDVWTTTVGMFVRINGSTVQLGTIGGSVSTGQIAVGSGTNTIAGSSNFTWDNSSGLFLIQASGFTASTGIARVNGTLTGSAGNHYMSGLTVTLDNAQTGGSNNALDGVLTNLSLTGSGTSNNGVNGFRTIVSIPTGQNTGQVNLFNGSMTTATGVTISTVYGSNLTFSVNGTVNNFVGHEMAATIFSTSMTTAAGYSDNLNTSGTGATITNFRSFASTAVVTSGDTVTEYASFYAAPVLTGNAINFYGAYLAPNVGGSGVTTTLYGVFIAPVNSGTAGTVYGIYQSGANVINQFEGQLVSNLSPISSQPALYFSGTWFGGGDATTTKPMVLIEPSGTDSFNWNTEGTAIGVNSAASFLGRFIDLQHNAGSCFYVDYQGDVFINGITTTNGPASIGQTLSISGLADQTLPTNAAVWADSGSSALPDNAFSFINTNSSGIGTYTFLLPPNPYPGQMVSIITAGAVAVFTVDGNGNTVSGAPSSLLADTSVQFTFLLGNWYRTL